jgi:hypothetical protein
MPPPARVDDHGLDFVSFKNDDSFAGGRSNIQTVRAEGMNKPPLTIYAVSNGEKALEALVI